MGHTCNKADGSLRKNPVLYRRTRRTVSGFVKGHIVWARTERRNNSGMEKREQPRFSWNLIFSGVMTVLHWAGTHSYFPHTLLFLSHCLCAILTISPCFFFLFKYFTLLFQPYRSLSCMLLKQLLWDYKTSLLIWGYNLRMWTVWTGEHAWHFWLSKQ